MCDVVEEGVCVGGRGGGGVHFFSKMVMEYIKLNGMRGRRHFHFHLKFCPVVVGNKAREWVGLGEDVVY